MVAWINKHKTLLQTLVILLGLCFLGLLLTSAYIHRNDPPPNFGAGFARGTQGGLPSRGRGDFARGARDMLSAADRAWRGMANNYAVAAAIGVGALIALYFLRLSFKAQHPWKDLARWVMRLLQVIHIPLAVIMLLAALGHGYYYLFYQWRPDLRDYDGVAALIGVALASGVGLVLTRWRKSRKVHLATAIIASALVLIHILTA
ncbi:MAG: hypothetical protein ACM3XM_01415 [Mycobacterium leprae]